MRLGGERTHSEEAIHRANPEESRRQWHETNEPPERVRAGEGQRQEADAESDANPSIPGSLVLRHEGRSYKMRAMKKTPS